MAGNTKEDSSNASGCMVSVVFLVVAFIWGGWWWILGALGILGGIGLLMGDNKELDRSPQTEDAKKIIEQNFGALPSSEVLSSELEKPQPNLASASDSFDKFYVDAVEASEAVDVNMADLTELLSLPGIGIAEAQLILKRRMTQPFNSIDDLVEFLSVKPHKIEQLKSRITFARGDNKEFDKSPGTEDAKKIIEQNFGALPSSEVISSQLEKPRTNLASASDSFGDVKTVGASEAVDVNIADLTELLSLPGIGVAEAQLILKRRMTRPFNSIDDLVEFLSVKPHKIGQLKSRVTFARTAVIVSAPDASQSTRSGGRVID